MNEQITPYYKHVFIVGCGDIGLRVAQRWLRGVSQVTGIVQSERALARLQAAHLSAYQVDFDQHEPVIPAITKQTLIYYFVPPPADGIEDSRCQHFLSSLSAQKIRPRRIVAISTTGVYGDCGGERVSEEQAPNPTADRARRRYDMENRLRQWCDQRSVDLVILRVSGIYGPHRLPLTRIQKGIPVLHEELAPKTNRIHEEDLADICVAAAKVKISFRIYNVSDGTDSNMTEYFYTLADHFNLPRPPAVDWQEAERVMSKGMLSYLKESRHIDNSRMLKELGIQLRYPNLQKGLSEISPDSVTLD